jgi:hypothetical protein
MRMRPVLTMLALGLAPLAVAFAESPKKPEARQVSFLVRVCESEDPRPLVGPDAEKAWDQCERPLDAIPVTLRAGIGKDGPRETDGTGTARVGPVRVQPDDTVTLRIGCTTHVCLTMNIDQAAVHAGENYFMWFTRPQREEHLE